MKHTQIWVYAFKSKSNKHYSSNKAIVTATANKEDGNGICFMCGKLFGSTPTSVTVKNNQPKAKRIIAKIKQRRVAFYLVVEF